jgi:hypothetical protein
MRPAQDGPPSSVRPSSLEEALCRSPQDYGLLSTVWTIRDLGALLAQQHGVRVSTATLHRALWHLGYRHRRPRHDLRHRQDPQAVAAARHVLDWLKKNAPQVLVGFDWSMWTNARSTSIPGWQQSGKSGASR